MEQHSTAPRWREHVGGGRYILHLGEQEPSPEASLQLLASWAANQLAPLARCPCCGAPLDWARPHGNEFGSAGGLGYGPQAGLGSVFGLLGLP